MAKRISGIAVTDVASLDTHIDKVRGSAICWTFSAADVRRVAELAEKRLELMSIAPTHRRGSVVTARSAGPASTNYKYSVVGAEITLRRASDGWRLTGYERRSVYPCSSEKVEIEISPKQQQKSIEAMLRRFRVTVTRSTESHESAAA